MAAVQSKGNTQIYVIPTGPGDDLHPVSITVTLDNPITAGNTLIVTFGCIEFGGNIGGISVRPPYFMHDTLSNGYAQISMEGAGYLHPGGGAYYSQITNGGSCTITFEFVIGGSNYITTYWEAAINVVEYPGTGTPQDHDQVSIYGAAGDAPVNLSVTNSVSAVIPVAFGGIISGGPGSICYVGLLDFVFSGQDEYFGYLYDYQDFATTPTSAFATFFLVIKTVGGTNGDTLYFWDSGLTPPLCPIYQRGNIDFDQIGIDARHGNGTKIQYYKDSGTPSTSGHLAKFEQCGNIEDAGIAASAVATKSGAFTDGDLIKANVSGDLVDAAIAAADVVTTLTTTGTSGAATKVGNTLNIPVYSSGGGGATIDHTTNLIKGDGSGNGVDSTIDPANVVTAAAALTANLPLIGSGGKATAVGTRSGNTTQFGTTFGTLTSGNLTKFDASGNIIDSGVSAASVTPINFADNEIPSGTINGSNVTFGLAHTPNPAGSLQLFRNGLLQIAGTEYTLATATITFATAPLTGDTLVAWYRY